MGLMKLVGCAKPPPTLQKSHALRVSTTLPHRHEIVVIEQHMNQIFAGMLGRIG